MKCGEAVHVRDFYGAGHARFIAQCGGRFLAVTNGLDYRNGLTLPDWRGVLRELITMTVPAKLRDRTMTAESTATGTYVNIQLTYPLSVGGLADLFGVPASDMRAELADLAVQINDNAG